MVSASLLSSSLLPPVIIDTGEYGADLMHQWKHYTKSTVIFNQKHRMTQYTFILYLEWLQKMFSGQRLLFVVDRSTTHYGKMITDWLSANHSSTSTTKIFIEYIQEGMTSVHQVWDTAINKPLKALIKKEYFQFRYDSLGDKTADGLVGRVLAFPGECLVQMIESAFYEINGQNQKRRWIARAFDQCGYDPWSEDGKPFETHLSSLDTNAVYSHMKTAGQQIKFM